MSLTPHARKLVVIIAEAALEKTLVREALTLGAQGYTISDVRGGGQTGSRDDLWEADRTIEMKVIAEADVALRIAERVLNTYCSHYRVSMFVTDVDVFRPERY